jgi:hypothetical protein
MVVEELSNEEQQIAAYTSYAYWAYEIIIKNNNKNHNNNNDDNDASQFNDLRIRMAMREAKRHYIGQNNNYHIALERLKSTIQWRNVGLCVCVYCYYLFYNKFVVVILPVIVMPLYYVFLIVRIFLCFP